MPLAKRCVCMAYGLGTMEEWISAHTIWPTGSPSFQGSCPVRIGRKASVRLFGFNQALYVGIPLRSFSDE